MKRYIFLTVSSLLIFYCSIAKTKLKVIDKGIILSSSGLSSPDPSAVLDINSTCKSALLARLTTAQRDEIENPAAGLIIYNLDSENFNAPEWNEPADDSGMWSVDYCKLTIPLMQGWQTRATCKSFAEKMKNYKKRYLLLRPNLKLLKNDYLLLRNKS